MRNRQILFVFFVISCFSCEKSYEQKIIDINKKYKYSRNSEKNPFRQKGHNNNDSCGISILYKKGEKGHIDIDGVYIDFMNDCLLKNVFVYLDNSISTATLSVGHCKFINFKKSFSKFKDMKYIFLNNLKVDSLEISGNNFSKILNLKFYDMNLSNFCLDYLPSLYQLDFKNVKITKFDTPAKNLPKIKSIIFSRTNLTSLKDVNFEGYPKGTFVQISTTLRKRKDMKLLEKIKKKYPNAIFDFSKSTYPILEYNSKTSKIDTIGFEKTNTFEFIHENTIIKDSTALKEKYLNINFSFVVGGELEI